MLFTYSDVTNALLYIAEGSHEMYSGYLYTIQLYDSLLGQKIPTIDEKNVSLHVTLFQRVLQHDISRG
jgi:hypothetical protein